MSTDLDTLAREIHRRARRGRGRSRPRGSAAALAAESRATRGHGATKATGRFVRADRSRPCPVCLRDHHCLIAADGTVALCARVPSEYSHGVTRAGHWWAHPIGRASGHAPRADHMVPREPAPERAPVVVRDRAYRAVLAALSLSDLDREGLRARGLDDETIAREGYRTLAIEGRARLARAVLDAVGDAGWQVPGVVLAEGDGRTWPSLGGAAGLLIPVRDCDGLIVALKVRATDATRGARYSSLSSARPARDGRPPYNGPPAEAAVHVPVHARQLLETGASRMLVTEGELKATVVTALSGSPCVSVPGVGAWSLALDAAARWRPATVLVAFDADAAEKPAVALAQEELLRALASAGHGFGRITWNPALGKGFDDALASLRRAQLAPESPR